MTGAIVSASENSEPSPATPKLVEIPAEDIKASAESNSIIYDRVNVIGDIELNQAEYESIKITNSVIEGNISVLGTIFNGRADFKNTSFHKKATFFGTRFEGETDFNASRFYEAANFSQARFLEGGTFDYNTFDKDADFSVAEFNNFGSFYDATFKGNATFGLSKFSGVYANLQSTQFLENADFAGAQFLTYPSFSEAKFFKNADFHACDFSIGTDFLNTTFLGPSRFERSQFSKDSLFRNVYFNNTADFTSAKFDGPSFFSGTQFCGNALFDGVQFMGPSDFSSARFDKDLAMNNTKISTMVLDGSTFNEESRLFLAKADINRFMVRWSMIKDILSFDNSAYLSLVKNYRDLGLNEADDCYYQYRYVSQNLKSWDWSKGIDILADISCGYGVKPDRPVICSLILVLFCTAILYAGNGLRSPSNKDKKTHIFDSLYYCLAIFFTIPLPDLKPAGRYKYVPVFLRALSWTLFALLIGTLSKVMIK